ncbi:hypothetical protein EI94DRAFT_1697140 [Lactarius quietus]|nr:hypothetical protein EI94DRAFT_1697140 [Lactarius quietus]
MSHPPILTDRDITPKVVREFENHCTTYFINAKDGMANDLKVSKILGCFKNTLIDDWAAVDWECFAKLSFSKFMREFQKQWLPYNWEETIHAELMNSRLNLLQKFKTWAGEVMSHNVSLRNTPSHLSDAQIHDQLTVAIDPELCTLATGANLAKVMDLHQWMAQIKVINDRRQFDRQRMLEVVDFCMNQTR